MHRSIVPIDSLTAQKRMVEAGFGRAVLPETSLAEELRTGTLSAIAAPRADRHNPGSPDPPTLRVPQRRRPGTLGNAAEDNRLTPVGR